MAFFTSGNSQQKSLHSIETEIEHLLRSLDRMKDEMGEQSHSSLKSLRSSAERALHHSRDLLGTTYEEVRDKTLKASAATRDYTREHPLTTAGIVVGALAVAGYFLLRDRD